MNITEKIFFCNYFPWSILFIPLWVIGKVIFFFRFGLRQMFCKHEFETKVLEASYGVFGGMKITKCKKCFKSDESDAAEKRLKANGLL